MIDLAFWHWLEDERKSGRLTRERTERCKYEMGAALVLFQSFMNRDTVETGSMIQECISACLHHHEVLRKK